MAAAVSMVTAAEAKKVCSMVWSLFPVAEFLLVTGTMEEPAVQISEQSNLITSVPA